MKEFICITNNSSDTINKLNDAGYDTCICCTFKDVKWLYYIYNRGINTIPNFHGLGNSCENECVNICPRKCIICSIEEALKYNENIHLFQEVEDCIKYIKSL